MAVDSTQHASSHRGRPLLTLAMLMVVLAATARLVVLPGALVTSPSMDLPADDPWATNHPLWDAAPHAVVPDRPYADEPAVLLMNWRPCDVPSVGFFRK